MSIFPSIDDILKSPSVSGTQKKTGAELDSPDEKFSEKMKEIDIKEHEMQVMEQARSFGLPYIDLSSFPVSSEALKAMPKNHAQEAKTICFFYTTEQIRLGVVELGAAADGVIDDFKERFPAAEIKLYLISLHSFERVLKLYDNLPVIKPVSKDIIITDEELAKFAVGINNLQSLQDKFRQVSITDSITLIVASALKVDSSDIHIEAEENQVAVRYRIDGILHDVAEFPKDKWKQFISRLKLLAALKINIADRPQDGRVTLQLSSGTLDVRVSTIPTTYGESVVLRILHSGNKGVTFDQLGLRGAAYEVLKREIFRPNGMIITTGPTGSGKTTTMYAILRSLNKPGVKIITLEDPVEIKMEGINQSQVETARDYTFAKGLKSILRQDPDICMVGEIRDLETAETAIQMALTGHLMLSTIHTNSASGAIPRFLSMGVKPFLLAPSLNSIIGQRLVRRVCEKCKEELVLDNELADRVLKTLQTLPEVEKKNVNFERLKFYQGKGCDVCSGLGYKGRVGIYEIFTMNKDVEQMILSEQVSEYVIQEIAIKNGMVTMAQDGLLKALDGITTVEEVFRVTE